MRLAPWPFISLQRFRLPPRPRPAVARDRESKETRKARLSLSCSICTSFFCHEHGTPLVPVLSPPSPRGGGLLGTALPRMDEKQKRRRSGGISFSFDPQPSHIRWWSAPRPNDAADRHRAQPQSRPRRWRSHHNGDISSGVCGGRCSGMCLLRWHRHRVASRRRMEGGNHRRSCSR